MSADHIVSSVFLSYFILDVVKEGLVFWYPLGELRAPILQSSSRKVLSKGDIDSGENAEFAVRRKYLVQMIPRRGATVLDM